jgi:RimJ/RimL family protein N-acetyltransferase
VSCAGSAVFATERLDVRAVQERDLDGLLAVYLSHPETLAVTEGSAGEAGRYDRGMLERDLWMSEIDPARHTAGLFLRDGGACIGVLDWVDENPNDGWPWVGLVMVHAGHTRRGYGSEALRGLIEHGRAAGWTGVRAAAPAGTAAVLALLESAGLHEIERRMHRFAAGDRSVVVCERQL